MTVQGTLVDKAAILEQIRSVASTTGRAFVTQKEFHQATGIPATRILEHFDSWAQACAAAGVAPGPTGRANLKVNPRISPDECLREMKRIATLLGKSSVTKADFNLHGRFNANVVLHRFGGWDKALVAADLDRDPRFHDEIELAHLADDFLAAAIELGRLPTLRQTVRRSHFSLNSFSRKFGGWDEFKREAIPFLLTERTGVDPTLRDLMQQEADRLRLPSADVDVRPLAAGQTLNFRAFAYAPTYEQDVVALFSTVAEELGFEILQTRQAFPDCIARRRINQRRRRYQDCRIEFELRSRDFVAHNHPPEGCDLIVCWDHNWSGCPLEVLELKAAIRRLPGWK
jgi:hypothetical protein